jgi:hypothetical protein
MKRFLIVLMILLAIPAVGQSRKFRLSGTGTALGMIGRPPRMTMSRRSAVAPVGYQRFKVNGSYFKANGSYFNVTQ